MDHKRHAPEKKTKKGKKVRDERNVPNKSRDLLSVSDQEQIKQRVTELQRLFGNNKDGSFDQQGVAGHRAEAARQEIDKLIQQATNGDEQLNIFFVGSTGSGKSTIITEILGENLGLDSAAMKSFTKKCCAFRFSEERYISAFSLAMKEDDEHDEPSASMEGKDEDGDEMGEEQLEPDQPDDEARSIYKENRQAWKSVEDFRSWDSQFENDPQVVYLEVGLPSGHLRHHPEVRIWDTPGVNDEEDHVVDLLWKVVSEKADVIALISKARTDLGTMLNDLNPVFERKTSSPPILMVIQNKAVQADQLPDEYPSDSKIPYSGLIDVSSKTETKFVSAVKVLQQEIAQAFKTDSFLPSLGGHRRQDVMLELQRRCRFLLYAWKPEDLRRHHSQYNFVRLFLELKNELFQVKHHYCLWEILPQTLSLTQNLMSAIQRKKCNRHLEPSRVKDLLLKLLPTHFEIPRMEDVKKTSAYRMARKKWPNGPPEDMSLLAQAFIQALNKESLLREEARVLLHLQNGVTGHLSEYNHEEMEQQYFPLLETCLEDVEEEEDAFDVKDDQNEQDDEFNGSRRDRAELIRLARTKMEEFLTDTKKAIQKKLQSDQDRRKRKGKIDVLLTKLLKSGLKNLLTFNKSPHQTMWTRVLIQNQPSDTVLKNMPSIQTTLTALQAWVKERGKQVQHPKFRLLIQTITIEAMATPNPPMPLLRSPKRFSPKLDSEAREAQLRATGLPKEEVEWRLAGYKREYQAHVRFKREFPKVCENPQFNCRVFVYGQKVSKKILEAKQEDHVLVNVDMKPSKGKSSIKVNMSIETSRISIQVAPHVVDVLETHLAKDNVLHPIFIPSSGRHGVAVEGTKWPFRGNFLTRHVFDQEGRSSLHHRDTNQLEPGTETIIFVVVEEQERKYYMHEDLESSVKTIVVEIPQKGRGVGFARQMILFVQRSLSFLLAEKGSQHHFNFFFMMDDDLEELKVYDRHLFIMRPCSPNLAFYYLINIMKSEIAELDGRDSLLALYKADHLQPLEGKDKERAAALIDLIHKSLKKIFRGDLEETMEKKQVKQMKKDAKERTRFAETAMRTPMVLAQFKEKSDLDRAVFVQFFLDNNPFKNNDKVIEGADQDRLEKFLGKFWDILRKEREKSSLQVASVSLPSYHTTPQQRYFYPVVSMDASHRVTDKPYCCILFQAEAIKDFGYLSYPFNDEEDESPFLFVPQKEIDHRRVDPECLKKRRYGFLGEDKRLGKLLHENGRGNFITFLFETKWKQQSIGGCKPFRLHGITTAEED